MAQTKISQLTELSSIADNDVLAGVDTSAGTTKKVKMSTLKSYINTGDAQDVQINGTSVVSGNVANIAVEGTYNASTNKLETVSDVNSKTGTLSNLTTTNKTNLVSAVNELNTNKEEKANKTDTLDENSTNTQYPGAKATYDLNKATKEDLENELSKTQAQLDTYKTIFNALPKVSGTGENISLDNTGVAPLNMELNGNTSQVQYSGKNILDVPSSLSVTGYIKKDIIVPSGTYTISASQVSLGGENSAYVRFSANGTTVDGVQISSTELVNTLTINRDADAIYVYSQNNYQASEGVTSTFTNLMIEQGSSATDYEPYVGNQPSPSPSYPQPIQVVSGDNEIEVFGKNLAPQTFDKKLNISGSGQNRKVVSSNHYASLIVRVKPNTNYTIGGDYSNLYQNALRYCEFNEYPQIGSISLTFNYSSASSFSFTTSNNTNYLLLYNANDTDTTIPNLFVSETSITTTYEPYQSTTYPISLGNLELCKIGTYQDKFIKPSGKNLINSVEYHKSCNSTTGDIAVPVSSPESYLSIADYIDVEPNTTYTISFEHDDLAGNLLIGTKDGNGNFIERTSIAGRTFTTGNNVHKVFLFVYKSGETFTTGGWVMLNLGTTALPYEPYGKGKWYLEKNIGKMLLDGSEDWNYDGSSSTPTPRTTFNRMYTLTNNIQRPNYFSNRFIYENTGSNLMVLSPSSNLRRMYMSVENTLTNIIGTETNNEKIEKLQTYLSNNNVYVDYQSATPTYTKIEGTLASQLDDIANATSCSTQTNINQISNDLPFIIDAETLLDISNIDNRVTLLED